MQIEAANEQVKLIPKTEAELRALHNIKYRGIKGMQLVGDLPDGAHLILFLGEDYIALAGASEGGGYSPR